MMKLKKAISAVIAFMLLFIISVGAISVKAAANTFPIVINGLKYNGNTITAVETTVYNYSGNAKALLAVYENGKLANIAMSNNVLCGAGNIDFELETPITATENQTVSAFIWETDVYGNITMNPLAEKYPKSEASSPDTKILITYFTVPETDDVDAVASASRVVEDGEIVGNVEFIAKTIQKETGGDMFAIETVQQYPGTHQELLDFAYAEKQNNARPELKTQLNNLNDYDIIFMGYPIWNADLPMPYYTFLDEYDFGGKTIIPFTAHGGSGFAGTINIIANQEQNATVERNGFSVSRNNVAAAKNDIIAWVNELGYSKPSESTDSSALVAYFSHTGRTQTVAEYIAESTESDIFRIEAAEPYAGTTSQISERAQNEKNRNARPAIASTVDDIDKYDTIFIGYPIWYYDAPMIIGTFLESYDLTGKTVIPFCTSATSRIDVSMDLIKNSAKGADVAEGLTANSGNSAIDAWLSRVYAR